MKQKKHSILCTSGDDEAILTGFFEIPADPPDGGRKRFEKRNADDFPSAEFPAKSDDFVTLGAFFLSRIRP